MGLPQLRVPQPGHPQGVHELWRRPTRRRRVPPGRGGEADHRRGRARSAPRPLPTYTVATAVRATRRPRKSASSAAATWPKVRRGRAARSWARTATSQPERHCAPTVARPIRRPRSSARSAGAPCTGQPPPARHRAQASRGPAQAKMGLLGIIGIGAVILVALALCVLLILALMPSEELNGTVQSASWERSVQIEALRDVTREAWQDDIPAGATPAPAPTSTTTHSPIPPPARPRSAAPPTRWTRAPVTARWCRTVSTGCTTMCDIWPRNGSWCTSWS